MYDPRNLVNDIVGLVLLVHCFAAPSTPSPTRYSRSVLINRLFMFNAAWYSDPKVFEALRRKARLRLGNRWVGTWQLRTRECFCIEAMPETSRKKSRETAESNPRVGPVFYHLPIRRSQSRNLSYTETFDDRFAIFNR